MGNQLKLLSKLHHFKWQKPAYRIVFVVHFQLYKMTRAGKLLKKLAKWYHGLSSGFIPRSVLWMLSTRAGSWSWHLIGQQFYDCDLRTLSIFIICCCCLVAKSCLTPCDPMDYSPPRLLFPWYFPGRNTAVGCHLFLQRIFSTQDRTHISCIGNVLGIKMEDS